VAGAHTVVLFFLCPDLFGSCPGSWGVPGNGVVGVGPRQLDIINDYSRFYAKKTPLFEVFGYRKSHFPYIMNGLFLYIFLEDYCQMQIKNFVLDWAAMPPNYSCSNIYFPQ